MSKLRSWKTIFFLCVFCAADTIGSSAQTLTTLLNFDGTNGASPYYSSLIQGTDGNFYGTTYLGGAYGVGTVFKITPEGKLTTLYSFCSQTNCADGASPITTLVQASNGNLYGTTTSGGDSSNCSGGCGTVFEITPEGTLTTLHSFDGTDGSLVVGGLVQATNGNLYGTTGAGGSNDSCSGVNGCGTAFEITPGGTLTTLHSFEGSDGYYALGNLVQGTDGNFYGTTEWGGSSSACEILSYVGCGTVFKITADGTLTTLYSFSGTDGSYPNWMVLATNGDFYATTTNGGTSSNCAGGCGTVFQITTSGTLTTLHSFDGTDGSELGAGLVQATNGDLYSTTGSGGANGYGTVFEITTGGTLTTLHSFEGTDGANSNGLVQGTDGNFYGTTYAGGASSVCSGGCGTVFSLGVGLGPFVETEPTSGPEGEPVIILGNDLTGATSVGFNGTAASFSVVSSTEIKTNVPKGARTGKVRVTTPSGTLTSNVPFRVTACAAAPCMLPMTP